MTPSPQHPAATASRVLITSHCVLNQNAVVEPLARSGGVMADAVDWALRRGYGIYQLPCPEFRFLGPKRPPMSTDEYNTVGFHESNAELLAPIVADLRRLHDAGAELVGALHVQGSPSCDPDTGNWVSDLLAAAEEAGVPITMVWQLPDTETGRFDPRSSRTRFGDPAARHGTPGGVARRQSVLISGPHIATRAGTAE